MAVKVLVEILGLAEISLHVDWRFLVFGILGR